MTEPTGESPMTELRFPNVRAVLEAAVARAPDQPYLCFEGQRLSYAEFDRRVNQTANAFRQLEVRKGDRVALMLPNCPEFLFCWLGLNKLGASMVPINTAFKGPEAEYIVNHSDARLLVVGAAYLDLVRSIRARCPRIEAVVALGAPPSPDALDFWTLVAPQPAEVPPVEVGPDDEASILYTSGTTGHPKGCVEPHSYYVLMGQIYARELRLTPDDRVITPLPLFHMNPQVLSTMGTLVAGASLALVDRFHPTRWWDEVRRQRATIFHYLGVMPAMLIGLPPRPDDADQPARIGVGAGVGPDSHARFEERFNCQLIEVFGMTEVGLNFCTRPGGERKVGTRCFGQVFPEYEARVVDDEDRDVPPGVVGELVLRGSDPRDRRLGFMKEYYKNPAATAEAWRGGWFHTGDFVRRDEEGYFYFVDRKKDIVRRSGENISSSEVEAVLRSHPKVLDVAVIPVPDPIREEEVKAYVILKPGETPATAPPEELLAWCSERLAYFKVPRYLEYRQSFPRTPTEKVQKQALKTEKPDLTAGSYDRATGAWRPG